MKELTIKQKAQKYNEALERARKLHSETKFDYEKGMMEEIFPELAESEDEKIKQWIIDDIRYNIDNEPLNNSEYKKKAEKAIAWLEKQGDTSMEVTCTQEVEVGNGNIKALVTEKIPVDKVKPKFHEDDWVVGANNAFKIISLNNELNSYIAVTQNNEEVKIPYYFDDAQAHMCSYHLWTIEDAKDGDVLSYKDEISIYKHNIKNCTKEGTNFGGFVYHCCYDGKRLVTDSLYSLTEKDKKDIHPATKEQRNLLFAKMKEAGYEWDKDKKELTKIEQKFADKVEPKFKVRDWVVDNHGKVNQITSVTDDGYGFALYDGTYVSGCWKDYYHLWTIKDAKNGDVLVYKGDVKHSDGIKYERICLFNNLNNAFFTLTRTSNYEEFNIDVNIDYTDNTVPATKEQKEILFMAMKGAGYEWDAERKELKKTNEEFNGEDYGIGSLFHAQRILEKTLGKVDGYQSDDGILDHKCAITAVKKLYKQKPIEWHREDEHNLNACLGYIPDEFLRRWLKDVIPVKYDKSAWSKEDENEVAVLEAYIRSNSWSDSHINRALGIIDELVNKLKSLRPQTTWKPSDNQVKAFEHFLRNVMENSYLSLYKHKTNVLYSLLKDLKKLKE